MMERSSIESSVSVTQYSSSLNLGLLSLTEKTTAQNMSI